MPRITRLNMSLTDIIVELADGNPGAVRVMMEIIEHDGMIDPDNLLGALGSILSLDTHGIYGSRIWMLYKDVCRSDIEKMLAALRAVQLGIARERDLLSAIDGNEKSFDADAALGAVKEKLPAFGLKAAAE